jgi:hypothetical protein
MNGRWLALDAIAAIGGYCLRGLTVARRPAGADHATA